MVQAWDTKALIEKMAAQGLHLTEELAKVIVLETLAWIEESVVLTENKIDDVAVPIVAGLKPYIVRQLDKIDKVEG